MAPNTTKEPTHDRLLKSDEAASKLGIALRTLWKRTSTGEIPAP